MFSISPHGLLRGSSQIEWKFLPFFPSIKYFSKTTKVRIQQIPIFGPIFIRFILWSNEKNITLNIFLARWILQCQFPTNFHIKFNLKEIFVHSTWADFRNVKFIQTDWNLSAFLKIFAMSKYKLARWCQNSNHILCNHKVIFGNSRMKILLHSRGNSISWLNLSSLHSTRSSYLYKSRAIFWEYL